MKNLMLVIVVILSIFSVTLGFAQDEATQKDIEVIKYTDNLYRVTCYVGAFSSNILAFTGKDGLLLVDAGYEGTSERVNEELKKIYDGNAEIIISTHAHSDHFGGNKLLGKDATIIAHETAKSEILGNYYGLKALPEQDLPVVAFDDELTIRFNGEEIKLIRLAGHTGSDILVHFVDSKIVCMGGLLYADQYPVIDGGRGGDIDVFIQTLEKLIKTLPADVKLIASHGRDYTMDDLKAHHEMMVKTAELIRKEKEAGKTNEEMEPDVLLKDWNEKWGQGPMTTPQSYTGMVYRSLMNQETPRPTPIVDPITHTIMDDGIEAAIKQYRKLKEKQPDAYDYGEGQLNMLGYQLIYRDMIKEAIEVFKLNAEVFPESANVYDSLGEAYMTNGDKELAIKNYEKTLEINPEYPSAIDALKKLKMTEPSDEKK